VYEKLFSSNTVFSTSKIIANSVGFDEKATMVY
jgi:hypothetical protein